MLTIEYHILVFLLVLLMKIQIKFSLGDIAGAFLEDQMALGLAFLERLFTEGKLLNGIILLFVILSFIAYTVQMRVISKSLAIWSCQLRLTPLFILLLLQVRVSLLSYACICIVRCFIAK